MVMDGALCERNSKVGMFYNNMLEILGSLNEGNIIHVLVFWGGKLWDKGAKSLWDYWSRCCWREREFFGKLDNGQRGVEIGKGRLGLGFS